jgi:hypothetical protein
MSANTTIEPSEGDNLLLVDDVVQVDLGSLEGHVLDSLGALSGVLEVAPHVAALGYGRLGHIIRLFGIFDHSNLKLILISYIIEIMTGWYYSNYQGCPRRQTQTTQIKEIVPPYQVSLKSKGKQLI